MPEKKARGLSVHLENLAHAITQFAGGTTAFALALGAVAVWGATGPLFRYSEKWQLAEMSKQEADLTKSHSVEEAAARHQMKHGGKKGARGS